MVEIDLYIENRGYFMEQRNLSRKNWNWFICFIKIGNFTKRNPISINPRRKISADILKLLGRSLISNYAKKRRYINDLYSSCTVMDIRLWCGYELDVYIYCIKNFNRFLFITRLFCLSHSRFCFSTTYNFFLVFMAHNFVPYANAITREL